MSERASERWLREQVVVDGSLPDEYESRVSKAMEILRREFSREIARIDAEEARFHACSEDAQDWAQLLVKMRVGQWTFEPHRWAALADVACGIDRRASATVPAEELAQMEARKDAAYLERNQVVAALAKVYPSGTSRTAIEGWSDDWHGCVYIDLPTGQVSWHYHDSQAGLFTGLPPYTKSWDGHSTEEKYQRLSSLQLTAPAPEGPTDELIQRIARRLVSLVLEEAAQLVRDRAALAAREKGE